jgi:hypothetical protein
LGAGFSVAAGLPTAAELWPEVLKRGLGMEGRAAKFKEDLDDFIEFKARCDGDDLTYDSIDFEEFIGFLDIEHHLGLRGKETWSHHGNEGQVVVKTLIAQILTELTPPTDKLPELYIEFAKRLRPDDVVFTFNYDIVLERALERAGVRYRLFPDRFTEVRGNSATVDMEAAEVSVLKVHGSVDWFDQLPYLERLDDAKAQGLGTFKPSDPVFNSEKGWTLTPIADGPRLADDPLRETYRLHEIERLYERPAWFLTVPTMISPSTAKMVYFRQIADFWRGWRYGGTYNFRLVIIGYSLPAHDDYARQIIYRLVNNYQGIPAERVTSRPIVRESVLLVDYQSDDAGLTALKARYSFVDWTNAKLLVNGFGSEALALLL